MQLSCQLCGRVVEIGKWQSEHERLRQGSEVPYICEGCQARVRKEARDQQRLPKPF